MTARQRRLMSDWEQVKKDFTGHKNIVVTPVGEEPYEKYNVVYFVNGIYLLPDGRPETLGRHEVEITLHAEYPRYKPICRIRTPIWHPNFREGQICIGDIWGAGESLSDIIINIGDMIQYKSWNSLSPLSAEAAEWAIRNKHLFPVGNIELYRADYSGSAADVEIELFDEDEIKTGEEAPVRSSAEEVPIPAAEAEAVPTAAPEAGAIVPVQPAPVTVIPRDGDDFEITAEELAGIEFVPSAQRMQTVSQSGIVKGQRVNFRTVFMKGLLWGLIGGLFGFILQELLSSATDSNVVVGWLGYTMNDLYSLTDAEALLIIYKAMRISTGISMALVACGIGLFMGIGEGVYYGSKEKAVKNALLGAGIGLVSGFVFGDIAQFLYTKLITDASTTAAYALARGAVWALLGVGIGLAVGLIKPENRRVIFCIIGGAAGGFVGGVAFNFVCDVATVSADDTGIVARALGFILLGLLIGLGIGLLEQFAKAAWLKVIRGEFEGKEYLVFSGTTSIGNNGKNTIVLFKDRLVGPHHCDIILEGSKYVLYDRGTPMGTVVNGQRITKHLLRQGDAIALGNSVLVFNTK